LKIFSSSRELGEKYMIRVLLCCLAVLTSIFLLGCTKQENTQQDNEIIKNAGKAPTKTGPAPANNKPMMQPPGV
jgi:hypothetical protein